MEKLFYKLAFALTILGGLTFVSCNDKEDPVYPTEILTFVFENEPLVAVQPKLNDEGDYVFEVTAEASKDELLLTPTITISPDCTVSPESGKAVDFAKGAVTYKVTSTIDGTFKEYKVSCTRHLYKGAMITKLTFEDEIVIDREGVEIPETGTEIFFHVSDKVDRAELNSLKPVFTVSPGATIEQTSAGSRNDFSEGAVEYTVTAENGTDKNVYTVDVIFLNSDAALTGVIIEDANDIILEQPEFTLVDKDIVFYVKGDATQAQIAALTIDLEIPEGASLSEIPEKPFAEGDVLELLVTSEDGSLQNEYTITLVKGATFFYGFDSDDWLTTGNYPRPAYNWESSNAGTENLIKYGTYNGPYGVYAANDSRDVRSGDGAAYVSTLYTNGAKKLGLIPARPKITAGSLYLGDFSIALSNPLSSTKFGIPFPSQTTSGKPIRVQGYYKYKAGDEYYRCISYDNNEYVIEEEETDICAIGAVLYEVSTYTGTSGNNQRLTGLNLYTDESIVALAQWPDQTQKSEWTEFDLKLEYIQDYDPEKLYRFAIVMSSSANGIVFSGAPGSVLNVDDITIHYIDTTPEEVEE